MGALPCRSLPEVHAANRPPDCARTLPMHGPAARRGAGGTCASGRSAIPALAEPPARRPTWRSSAPARPGSRRRAGSSPRASRVAVLEARDRVGGRAVTVPLRGHPVDLGAHWLHAGPINPLVRARARARRAAPAGARRRASVRRGRRGRPRRARRSRPRLRARRPGHGAGRARAGGPAGREGPAAHGSLGPAGRRRSTASCPGRPLDEVSLHDFPSMEYCRQLASSPAGSAPMWRASADGCRSGSAPPRRPRLVGPGVRIETAAGTLQRQGGYRDRPDGGAAARQHPLHARPCRPRRRRRSMASRKASTSMWCCTGPVRPFRGADRLASLVGRRREPPGLLTCIDGTPFHFFELDQPRRGRPRRARPRRAGAPRPRASWPSISATGPSRGLSVPAITRWRHDPLAARLLGRGAARAVPLRETLKAPVGERIWFAGEALSRAAMGHRGGAWEEGERAARGGRAPASRPSARAVRACSAAPGPAAGGRP